MPDQPILLLDRLRECELIEPAQCEELASLPEAKEPDPRALGKVLLQRKLLSKFQINLAAQGRGKELRVGPYLLLDKLGEGGMGQVFKATHRHMSRVVALKVIRKEKLANADSVQRFYKEVQAAAQLHHPNIVLAYDAGQAGSTHYFAMEFVEGTDLANQVKTAGPLPVALACEYVRQAALGLQHAHEKGLVHRDVKPHNLLVTRAGGRPVVKLLDMGLARLAQQGETGLTRSGQVLGTPDYLAPEQAFDSRKADARSDVYSLGCTLYFLLTGSAPFSGDTLTQVLLKHQMEEVSPLTQRRPDVPPALDAVLRRMIAKSPDDRYQTAAEVTDALGPFSRGEAGEMPPPPPPSRFENSGDTWAGLEEDGAIARVPKSSRSATRLEEEDPPRRKKAAKKEDADATRTYLVIAAAAGVPVLGLLVVGLVVLLMPGKRPAEPPPDKGKVGVASKDVDRAGKKLPEADKDDRPELPPRTAVPLLTEDTRLIGGGFGGELYRDVAPDGGWLVGLEVGLGKWSTIDVTHSFRAVFRSGDMQTLGPQRGTNLSRVTRLIAKPGYAVGAAKVKSGANADGISLTFMRIKGGALDPTDSYESDWVGDVRPGGIHQLGGTGQPAIGVVVKANTNVTGLALILGKEAPGK